jgi:hypothetical protein
MKSMRELIELLEAKTHGTHDPLSQNINATLPGAYVIPQLRNTDPYMQYRYSLALAAAAGRSADPNLKYEQEREFAENLTLVTYTEEDKRIIDLACKLLGVQLKQIADTASREPNDTHTSSPIPKQK